MHGLKNEPPQLLDCGPPTFRLMSQPLLRYYLLLVLLRKTMQLCTQGGIALRSDDKIKFIYMLVCVYGFVLYVLVCMYDT